MEAPGNVKSSEINDIFKYDVMHVLQIFVTSSETSLTSDDELSEVGDGSAPGGQGHTAVEVLLPTLRLHLERCHQPFVAQPRQQGSVQQHAVSPLTARQRPHTEEKSAMSAATQPCMFTSSLLEWLDRLWGRQEDKGGLELATWEGEIINTW